MQLCIVTSSRTSTLYKAVTQQRWRLSFLPIRQTGSRRPMHCGLALIAVSSNHVMNWTINVIIRFEVQWRIITHDAVCTGCSLDTIDTNIVRLTRPFVDSPNRRKAFVITPNAMRKHSRPTLHGCYVQRAGPRYRTAQLSGDARVLSG